MKSPLVTIITPSYNQGRFIRATIESVLSQDYPHIEYIVMDGGSSDETAKVVNDYRGRLKWISERDRGQSHAINKGFRLAKGDIVSWLNSDDVILPGAVAHAAGAFERDPMLGAVYGEGYQIDIDGNVKHRFFATEPFNLWKLIYLSDYILQQSSYFRKSVFDEVGHLDESLHWGMDWDIFVRIGKRFKIEYIPEYMGSIREYATAKSFAGGGKRFRELASIMRRHGGVRYPPGYITYGLDTYSSICRNWLEARTPPFLSRPSRWMQWLVRGAADYVIARTLREAQGLYSDGWAGPNLKYMLAPGSGTARISGMLPGFPALKDQKLTVICDGREVARLKVPFGVFELTFTLPSNLASEAVNFVIKSSRSIVPARSGNPTDDRRLAYMMKAFEWV